ncbi:MAG: carboxypeptidase M32 [Victivallales bacterium]|nr:carboxypeptidase M32 [Victivallales bacterium]
MNKDFEILKKLIYEINDIEHAAAVLNWDQEAFMPEKGISDRVNQISTLSKIAHEKFTTDKMGDLIEKIKEKIKKVNPESDEARLIKVLDRNYKKSVKVPSELVTEMSKAASLGQQNWAIAKRNSDFSAFVPYLKKLIELRKQYAKIFTPYDHIYDPLLDDFEPGLKTADVKEIFKKLKPSQAELLNKIAEKQKIDNSFLFGVYNKKKQRSFGADVITKLGYDWSRGRQDTTEHPFTTNFGIDDVRITTKIDKNYLPTGLFGSIHEAGHAIYEQGIAKELARTPLAEGASLAIHESQSRLWENLVGRSLAFWKYFYPKLQNIFPENLDGVSLEKFYKGINKVAPTMIRVEADEATYNMHIMVRFELETALVEETVNVKDLPEIWNLKMKEYFGITPVNDAQGVLQDIHWSMGAIGYFTTYALGNLISAQLWECINRDIRDLNSQIEKGNFDTLLHWLRNKIYMHGSKYEPQELVEKVTGTTINPAPYIRYLKAKYSDIYSL